jgi:hypothetical protein
VDFESVKCHLWNCKTKSQIRSGDIFTIKTVDPEKLPLPNFVLLELQWFMARMLAIRGAGEEDRWDGEDWKKRYWKRFWWHPYEEQLPNESDFEELAASPPAGSDAGAEDEPVPPLYHGSSSDPKSSSVAGIPSEPAQSEPAQSEPAQSEQPPQPPQTTQPAQPAADPDATKVPENVTIEEAGHEEQGAV